MAVSGSFDLNNTATELINDALERIGKRDIMQTTPAEVSETCKRTLNHMIKHWQTRDVGLWLVEDVALFLESGGTSYDIYGSGDHATTSFVKTEVATAASSGASTLTVDSDTGISNGDYIGIELDDGTLQWTTVNGAPAADVITLTAALTDDVAVDNHVYTYTTKAQKPLEILEARLYLSSDTEYPISLISRELYKNLADKDATGKCVELYQDARIDRMTVYTWPACDDVKDYIKLSAKRRIDDIDDISDNVAFPAEWLLTLSTNLAFWIAPKFGVSMEKLQTIKLQADETFRDLMMFDREGTSFTVEPVNS
ncbi:MAG: hypothetical protein ACQ9ET_03950 [Nitrosomonadaceae bacterium]